MRIALFIVALALSTLGAHAQDAARPEAMVGFFQAQSAARIPGLSAHAPIDIRTPVQQRIAQHVTERLGSHWVGTALRIAKIESRSRCNARNGRAVGIFQNTNPQIFGVSRAAALTCDGGIRAGVAHMVMCVGKGARTASQMMVCHNAGTPFARRVERAYRFALRN